MPYDPKLAEQMRAALKTRGGIVEKKMFGGYCWMLNGNMLVGVWKDSLVVRVGPEAYDDARQEPHVGEFDITGKPMKGWVLVDQDGVEEDDQLKEWLQRAIRFVDTLPSK